MYVILGILRQLPSSADGKVFEHHVSASSIPLEDTEQLNKFLVWAFLIRCAAQIYSTQEYFIGNSASYLAKLPNTVS